MNVWFVLRQGRINGKIMCADGFGFWTSALLFFFCLLCCWSLHVFGIRVYNVCEDDGISFIRVTMMRLCVCVWELCGLSDKGTE